MLRNRQESLSLPFIKMQGLGNDFVVLDWRMPPWLNRKPLTSAQIQKIADRHFGIGCDQLVLINPPQQENSKAFVQFFNPDGSEAEACGNASRCLGHWFLSQDVGLAQFETRAGILQLERVSTNAAEVFAVNMGKARFAWPDIPLSQEIDTLAIQPQNLGIPAAGVKAIAAVNIGNPHCVIFLEDMASLSLSVWGKQLEHHALFPQRANIEIVKRHAANFFETIIWERGAGFTLACGSAACAIFAAAEKLGMASVQAEISMPGGRATVIKRDDENLWLQGPAEKVFEGFITENFLS